MSARIQIHLGFDDSPALFERYRELIASSIGSAAWIAPTERARDGILERLARANGAALCPQVWTFPDLAAASAGPVAGSRKISEAHQRLLLDQMLEELRMDSKLPWLGDLLEFPSVVDAVFSLHSELAGLGVEPDEFIEFIQQLYPKPRPKDRDLALIYKRFTLLFDKHGLIDRSALYALAVEKLKLGVPASLSQLNTVFVAGFSDFTPPQYQLLLALAGHVEAMRFSLPAVDDGRDELFLVAFQTRTRLCELFGDSAEIAEPDDARNRRAGLEHIRRHLFRVEPPKSHDADGLSIIEAPDVIGEVRMVARHVKSLLLGGAKPGDVLVSARSLSSYSGLIAEIFSEYGLPFDMETHEPLSRRPSVSVLLSALQLGREDWPFAPTAALLRSTYFRPPWPEAAGEMNADAELFLRQLGIPIGREHFLNSLVVWAEAPKPGLDDEDAEESKRRRLHELAKRCEPFLRTFFAAWEGAPASATFAEHTAWLQQFAIEFGIAAAGDADSDLDRFWHELSRWARREEQMNPGPVIHSFADYVRTAIALAASVGVVKHDRGPGRIRVVPADLAVALDCEHLVVMGLGERSFPNLGVGDPLYGDVERLAFQGVGLSLTVAEQRLPAEMLLFFRLLTSARKSVTLARPAVDAKGLDLLPGAFFRSTIQLFESNSITAERKKMLVEGIGSDRPLSPAEYRVRYAIAGGDSSALSPGVSQQLHRWKSVVAQRFERDVFGVFDGMFAEPEVLALVQSRFGPNKEFSPTALDQYIACPFRFMMGNALSLAPLDEPSEEVQDVSRGAAFHRALARLHSGKKTINDVSRALAGEMDFAVAEAAERSSSPTLKRIWELEGERLQRFGRKYAAQADRFCTPWREAGIDPRPNLIEAEFGSRSATGPLVLTVDGIEFRLHGRIDRIDTFSLDDGALGFWVIDYKTGRGESTKATGTMEKLQLPLYAMAAEKIIGVESRPLGLAYWNLMKNGPQTFPSKMAWRENQENWLAFRARLEQWLAELVRRIRSGQFPLRPRSKASCDYCEFSQACRINQSRATSEAKDWVLPLPGDDVDG